MNKNNKQPLAEVFGHLVTDQSLQAQRYRQRRLCPFNNRVPNCTKDKAKDPLGVCSIYSDLDPVITCPIRFREDWIIADDAAEFFFPPEAKWTTLTEVRLNDCYGKSAGNIDVVLVAYDEHGEVYDFGALEIQGVYISGNVRNPFNHYLKAPLQHADMDWSKELNYPRPDYLSSSRKRLAPQLLFKGGILHAWKRKIAVALNQGFFATLPDLPKVDKNQADIAWLVYSLKQHPSTNTNESIRFKLIKQDIIYTQFQSALNLITKPTPGKITDFMKLLQEKLDEHLESPPITESIENPFTK